MLDSNHAGHPHDDDDDDEWQTTFSSWDRYGKIVVDFSPVLSITYLSTETWHGNSNFENNSNMHHTKKRKTKRKIQKRNSFTEENYRRLQISLPVHIQNACSTFRILVSKAIILGLATKRKEKKRKCSWNRTNSAVLFEEEHSTWTGRHERLSSEVGSVLLLPNWMCREPRHLLPLLPWLPNFTPRSKRTSISNKTATKCSRNRLKKYTNPPLQTSISVSLSLSLSFAKQLRSLHNCAEQEQERRDLSFTVVTTVTVGGKFWQP